MFGGRKVRSNKGKKRGSYGSRTGKTRSGKRFRTVAVKTRKVGRKTRSNKGKKRTPYGPRTGKTRSGKKFRGGFKDISEATGELWGAATQCNNMLPRHFMKDIFQLDGVSSCSGMQCSPNSSEMDIINKYKAAGCPWDSKNDRPIQGPPPCEPMDSDSCLKEPTCHLAGTKCVPCTEKILYSMGCKSAPGVTPQIRQ